MDRKNLDRFYADNVRLVHSVARRCFSRLQAIGAVMDYEDVFQELSEIFVRAYDKFDDTAGYKFSTYYMTSAYNGFNKIAKSHEVERLENGVRSMEEMGSRMDDESDIYSVVASEAATPEQTAVANSSANGMLKSLSPIAALIAELAIDPPDWVEHEFNAAQVHAECSRNLGKERRARGSLNVSFVAGLLEKVTTLPAGTIRAGKLEVLAYAERNLK